MMLRILVPLRFPGQFWEYVCDECIHPGAIYPKRHLRFPFEWGVVSLVGSLLRGRFFCHFYSKASSVAAVTDPASAGGACWPWVRAAVSVHMWVLFYFLYLNVSHLLMSLESASTVALWRSLVVGAVMFGLNVGWTGPCQFVVLL